MHFQIPVYSKPKFQKVIEKNTLVNALTSTLTSMKIKNIKKSLSQAKCTCNGKLGIVAVVSVE